VCVSLSYDYVFCTEPVEMPVGGWAHRTMC